MVMYPTALDRHAANVEQLAAAIAADPTGPQARAVRDDLRRAHPVGVTRNERAIADLLAAFPPRMLAGVVRSRCAAQYRTMLAPTVFAAAQAAARPRLHRW